jgi:hypothetical protein
LLALVIALFLRSRSGQVTALVLVLVCAGSAWPVVVFGERAYDNISRHPMRRARVARSA